MSFKKKSNVSGLNKIGFIISWLFLAWSIFAFNDLFWNFGSDGVGYIWLSLGIIILLSQILSVMSKYKRSEDIRNIVLQEYRANPNASIEEVARSIGLSRESKVNDLHKGLSRESKVNDLYKGLKILGLMISMATISWSIFAFLDLFWNFGTTWLGFVWLGIGGSILFVLLVSKIRKNTFIEG